MTVLFLMPNFGFLLRIPMLQGKSQLLNRRGRKKKDSLVGKLFHKRAFVFLAPSCKATDTECRIQRQDTGVADHCSIPEWQF